MAVTTITHIKVNCIYGFTATNERKKNIIAQINALPYKLDGIAVLKMALILNARFIFYWREQNLSLEMNRNLFHSKF